VHVSVIAKEPRPGFVKTRLCPPCSPGQAAALAAAALLDTLDAVDALVVEAARLGHTLSPTLLFEGDAGEWSRPGYTVLAQRGNGLEQRLSNGFAALGPGFVVGMEAPHAVATIANAFDAVAAGGDAIGLAHDGGYWVIGLGGVDHRVFTEVPMSESHTGLAQIRRLHALRRRVRMLPMARDLDTIADVEAVARSRNHGRLPGTARSVLAEL
jgi:glycosyltransferase A (GT-A) superfamily protein (DUF2064 family)